MLMIDRAGTRVRVIADRHHHPLKLIGRTGRIRAANRKQRVALCIDVRLDKPLSNGQQYFWFSPSELEDF